jgi:hypothetical protein
LIWFFFGLNEWMAVWMGNLQLCRLLLYTLNSNYPGVPPNFHPTLAFRRRRPFSDEKSDWESHLTSSHFILQILILSISQYFKPCKYKIEHRTPLKHKKWAVSA